MKFLFTSCFASVLATCFVIGNAATITELTNETNRVRDVRHDEALLPHSYEVSIRLINRHFCSGAIIGPRFVLTAAHCFYRNDKKYPEPLFKYMSVVAGSNGDLTEGGTIFKIKNVTTHEDLSKVTNEFWISDIALITLESEIPFTALQRPVGLPNANLNETDRAQTSIWSSPVDVLKTVEVYFISHAKCTERLKERYLGEHAAKICGYTSTGRGLCLNNGGSPLVQGDKIVGIGSRSEGCTNGNPDIYINIYRNLDFINRAMAQNFA